MKFGQIGFQLALKEICFFNFCEMMKIVFFVKITTRFICSANK